jgi:hypothetical protein
MSDSFMVGDIQFELSPLKLEQQMAGWGILGSVVLPAIGQLASQDMSKDGIASVLAGVERLPELLKMFAGACKVQWQSQGMVPLTPFLDNVFSRRSDLVLGFLAECVTIEYASFLDERGKSVLLKAASRFAFLKG